MFVNVCTAVTSTGKTVIERISLDEYITKKTNATDEDKETALEMLNNILSYPLMGVSGRRNDDAVNLCIVARVLGIPFDSLWGIIERIHCITLSNILQLREHFDRVIPYAESWGPDGDEGNALDYRLDQNYEKFFF